MLLGDGGGLSPEFPGGHAQVFYEIILLHIRGAEGLVEIVENTDGRLGHIGFLLLCFRILIVPQTGGEIKGKGEICPIEKEVDHDASAQVREEGEQEANELLVILFL